MLPFARIDSFTGNSMDPAWTEPRCCPACGADRPRRLVTYRGLQFFTDSASIAKRADISMDVCGRCCCAFTNPVYTTAGFAALFSEAGLSYGAGAGRYDEQAAWLSKHALLRPGAAVLDVGCYEGSFLASLPAGFRRHGIDIDAPAIARARTRHPDISFTCAPFADAAVPTGMDLITMMNVLEHVPDPVPVLARLRSAITPGGRLVVEVPVVEHGESNDINGFFVPLHLTHFSLDSLNRCLVLGGWEIEHSEHMVGYPGHRVVARPARPGVPAPAERFTDLARIHRLVAHWHGAIAAVEERLAAIPDDSPVVVWGGGMHTELLYHLTSLFRPAGRRFVCLDKDASKQGRTWRGIPILAPGRLVEEATAPVVVSSYAGTPSIANAARDLGVSTDRIIRLYDVIMAC